MSSFNIEHKRINWNSKLQGLIFELRKGYRNSELFWDFYANYTGKDKIIDRTVVKLHIIKKVRELFRCSLIKAFNDELIANTTTDELMLFIPDYFQQLRLEKIKFFQEPNQNDTLLTLTIKQLEANLDEISLQQVHGWINDSILEFTQNVIIDLENDINNPNLDEIVNPFYEYVTQNLKMDLTLTQNPEMRFDTEFIEYELIDILSEKYAREVIDAVIQSLETYYGNSGELENKWLNKIGELYLMENHTDLLEDVQRFLRHEPITPFSNTEDYESRAKKMKLLDSLSGNNIVEMDAEYFHFGIVVNIVDQNIEELQKVLESNEITRLNEIRTIFLRFKDAENITISKERRENSSISKVEGVENSEELEQLLAEVGNFFDIAIYLIRRNSITEPFLK